MIAVTQTFLPPKDEYYALLNRAWDKKWLTNRGELVKELEKTLKDYLQIQNILITNNGTIPLQIALKLFGNKGKVITTPFSYVATTAAIVWENCTPVFVDIHPDYLTIDEEKIEEAITPDTTAIMATHVFGNPCHVERITEIAQKHGIKVIYDAAHGFGVNYNGRSVFNYGDISTCSFHATKIFHTAEGGALFCGDDSQLYERIFYSHNFGHKGTTDFQGLGVNGKISELQAAMGLAVFPYIQHIISERKRVIDLYMKCLGTQKLKFMKLRQGTDWNYSYLPVIFESEEILLCVQKALSEKNIFPRRYFYPSLNHLPYLDTCSMPVSESISTRVMCMPVFDSLGNDSIEMICDITLKCLNEK